ncbi:aspartate kinase [mine drainage metagenome]|uniref:homoserine dehydrogenase n=3 Tax=mine drainage metagenome TaxID=410659 RepID=T1C3M2_9ZZZZ
MRPLDSDPTEACVQLCIVGHTGQVGRALLNLLEATALDHLSGLNWRIAALANQSQVHWPQASRAPERRVPGDWPHIVARFRQHRGPKFFVDCSADESVVAQYPLLLRHRISIITPNKLAFSASQSFYASLQRIARQNGAGLHYETTVGASLPVLSTVRNLLRTGDRITRVEACLSGTWSYLLNRIHLGIAFSQAVEEAQTLGYVEPDPAADLAGLDGRRKLLILLREAGLTCEPADITGDRPTPPGNRNLADCDSHWSKRVSEAVSRGQRLVYRAGFDGSHARVELVTVPAGSILADLAPGENRVCFWTRRYSTTPLSIAGPGAGPELTAAGVLLDMLRAEAGLRLVINPRERTH